MKLLFDLFPVLIFFGTFKYAEKNPEAAATLLLGLIGDVDVKQAPILLSTLVVIVATLLQIGWARLRHGTVDKMLWVSLILVTVLGGLTLLFKDEAFIKWKPTLLYWVFAGSLAISRWVLKKDLLRNLLGAQMTLPDAVWRKVNVQWIAFFAAMGVLNLIIAFNFPLDVWVDFKVFGGMGLMLVFILAQGVFLSRYVEESK